MITNLTFHVFDTETTGFEEETDKIVEIAYSKIENGIITKNFQSLVNPGIPIPPEASAVHHIVDEDVADSESIDNVINKILNEEDIKIMVAHNIEFDYKFLKQYFPNVITICTYRLAKKLWPDLKHHTNQYLRYYFKLGGTELKEMPAHRAMADTFVTSYLFMYELREIVSRASNPENITPEKLQEYIEKPILLKKCNFGKHKDELWQNVPKSYLNWMLNNMNNLDRDTIYTANHYLGRN